MCARERDRWWFLLLGALVLLAWNPYNLLDAGFQLSFSAVAAIFTLVPPLMRWLEGYPVPRAAAAVVAVSIACGVATAPILLFQFGSVPAYSVIANAMAAPVVAPLLGLGLLAAAVHPIVPDVAALLVWLDGWLAAYLVLCARAVASVPHAQLSAAPVLLMTAGLAAVVVLGRRSRTLAVAFVAAGLVAIAWRAAPDPVLPPPTGLRVTFLDVGQGDATLIQVPRGSLLVDQGPPEANVAQQLRRFGIRELSLLVLTHPQRDHVGGAADVLEQHARPVRCSIRGSRHRFPRSARRSRKRRNVAFPSSPRGRGSSTAIGRLRVRVLWPDGPGVPSEDPNLRATVCLVSYGEVDVLLGADAESPVLLPLRLPPVEILKVSHHGSADAVAARAAARAQAEGRGHLGR